MQKLNSHQLRKSRVGLPAGRQGSQLNSHQLRSSNEIIAKLSSKTIPRNQIVLVLDNVLDTYNIGSFFRLADAIGAQKIYLCGDVVTPPNLKIHRSSIGTWKWVPWEQVGDTHDCLKKLKQQNYTIIACEQTANSKMYDQIDYQYPLAIVAGSEVNGVGESVLTMCDHIAEIPMYGINKSLNVLVATSIICFEALKKVAKVR